MKTKHDFIGSWWASKGSYGKPLANNPGEGAGHLGGTKGAYASASTESGDPHAMKGKKIANSPGMGSGHMSNTPVGGKKGRYRKPADGKKGHYDKGYAAMHMGED